MKCDHPLYAVWCNMVQRCEDRNHGKYAIYGGRGIRVCAQWAKRGNRWSGTPGLDAFIADMGRRPSLAHTLERKNTDGNYEPDNCIWAKQKHQQRNRRNNRIIVLRGRSRTLAEWAERIGLDGSTIRGRLDRGWSIPSALLTPATR